MHFFVLLETIPPLFCLINTIPVCRMANAGHNACKSKDVHPEKDNFTVMKSEIFAENAQKSTGWAPHGPAGELTELPST